MGGDGRWQTLPIDFLQLILHWLPTAPDRIRFRAVCSWWRFVFGNTRHYLPPPTPLLLLSGIDTNTRELFSLSESKSYTLHLPQVARHRKYCFGVSQGWLFIVDQQPVALDGKVRYNIHVLNPITGAEIQLPPASGFPVYTSNQSYKFPIGISLYKAILSSDPRNGRESIAMAIDSHRSELGFCRLGDRQWTHVASEETSFQDVLCFEGKFYAVTDLGHVVVVCDVDGPNPKAVEFALPRPRFHNSFGKYLVECSGEILQAIRYDKHVWEGSELLYRTTTFEVFKLNRDTRLWTEMKSLGDKALLLGAGCSMSVSSQAAPEYKKNCIYFTDNEWGNDIGWESGEDDDVIGVCIQRRIDLGVFNLEDGSIEHLYVSSPGRIFKSAMFWVTPNLDV